MSSGNNEANGNGRDMDSVIISYQLKVLYPTRSGCREKSYPDTRTSTLSWVQLFMYLKE